MNASTPEERAKRRTDEYVGMLWHVAAFVIINAMVWGIDYVTTDGIQWAYWVTGPWLVGLLFHMVAYFVGERVADRAYERFLEQEKAKAKKK